MNKILLAALIGGCGAPADPDPTQDCTPASWFPDGDGDGVGSDASTVLACTAPEGHVAESGDCDDTDPLVGETDPRTFWVDGDGDGFGGPVSVVACRAADGFADGSGDCDDADPAVNPAADEACNGLDDDCDQSIPADEDDADGDGHRVCDGDCDDTDAEIHPGATERCNGLDDDCDGSLSYDEEDSDLDGWSTCDGDCDDLDGDTFPDAAETVADGRDADCDGTELCWFDGDGDGEGTTQTVPSLDLACDGALESTTSTDCDDGEPAAATTLSEVPYDGIDNDCDPLTRDDDVDGDGYLLSQDCNDHDPAINPLSPPDVVFTDETVAAGLWAIHWDPVASPAQCGMEGMAGGASAADHDNDGDIDLFVPRLYLPDQLYENAGDGTFTEVAAARGIQWTGTSNMGVWFDAEADGDLDLYVVSMGTEGNRLYLNDGTGHYTEEAAARGVDMAVQPTDPCSWLWGVSAADVDGDGDLDLHTDQWHSDPFSFDDRSRLFLNDGTGFFTEATLAAGLDLGMRAAFSSSFGDVDGDGDLDLALAADWQTSGLWLNDGSGVFTEVTALAGVGTDENGMGSDLADFDGDGDLDWLVTSIYDPAEPCSPFWGCTGNRLYVNDGTGTFTDGTDAAGVRDGGWGWGAAFFDHDNDGDLDIGHANGFPTPAFENDEIRLFDNDGTGVFTEIACEAGAGIAGQARSMLPIDVDGDGDLDVFSSFTEAPPRLLVNQGGDVHAWLRVQASEPGNPFGLGATVWVTPAAGGPEIRRDIHANTNFAGTRPPEVHFGLGTHETDLHQVRVVWPDGGETILPNRAVRQVLHVVR